MQAGIGGESVLVDSFAWFDKWTGVCYSILLYRIIHAIYTLF